MPTPTNRSDPKRSLRPTLGPTTEPSLPKASEQNFRPLDSGESQRGGSAGQGVKRQASAEYSEESSEPNNYKKSKTHSVRLGFTNAASRKIKASGEGLCPQCLVVVGEHGQTTHLVNANVSISKKQNSLARKLRLMSNDLDPTAATNGLYMCLTCHHQLDHGFFTYTPPLKIVKAIATEWLAIPYQERPLMGVWITENFGNFGHLYHCLKLSPEYLPRLRRPTSQEAPQVLRPQGQPLKHFNVFSTHIKHAKYRLADGDGADPMDRVNFDDEHHQNRLWHLPGVDFLNILALLFYTVNNGDYQPEPNTFSSAVWRYIDAIRSVVQYERATQSSLHLRPLQLKVSLPTPTMADDYVSDADAEPRFVGQPGTLTKDLGNNPGGRGGGDDERDAGRDGGDDAAGNGGSSGGGGSRARRPGGNDAGDTGHDAAQGGDGAEGSVDQAGASSRSSASEEDAVSAMTKLGEEDGWVYKPMHWRWGPQSTAEMAVAKHLKNKATGIEIY